MARIINLTVEKDHVEYMQTKTRLVNRVGVINRQIEHQITIFGEKPIS